nr:NBS-LRR disease resistance protein [Dasypyrum villosum]
MHGAVCKYTTLQDPDVQVKAWISLVRELAYDIEDVIDKFIHRLSSGGLHQGGFKEFFRKTARRLKTLGSRRGIASQIDDLKISSHGGKRELKTSYNLHDIPFEHLAVDPRLSALFVDEEAHSYQSSSTKHRKVLSIFGFGGYLIIIDDIWSISAWSATKYAFPDNDFSSRIIATTRIVDVARSCCLDGNGRMYEIEALSDLHSQRLFFKRIFGTEGHCPVVLKQVSNKILKKCGGLPLAIICISSLLATKPMVKDEWERVRRSIGSALDKGRSLDGMNSILSLSYNDLSLNLKTCLLYLSLYPEDYVIERDILVRRWIAEGFISEERGQSKQEVAENHFYELINKSMVQPVEIGYDGKARACQVHDMMLELIISKSVEDNFITLAGHGQTDLVNHHGLIRRLSVQHIDQEIASILANEDLSHVRSLTVTASTCIKHLPMLVRFEALRVLEFQNCESLNKYDMDGIDKLFQLKYLSFRATDMSKLPSGIVKLYGLETLDIRNTQIEELPTGIIQLGKLQHLLTARYPGPHGEIKLPNGIGNMRNLQVISGFNIIKSPLRAVEELGNLNRLKELHLQLDGGGSPEYKRHEEMLFSSLCKLVTCKLQSLWIYSPDSTPIQFLDSWSPLPYNLQTFWMTTSYYLPKMPKWIVPALTSLSYLNINLIDATEDDLRMLGEMPALLSLSITFNTFQKERFTVHGIAFPCLKELYLICWESAIYLTFEEGALPKLEKLVVPFNVSVAEEYGFYLDLGHLPCLRDAIFTLCNYVGTSSVSCSAAAAAIRNEANCHPNRPRLSIRDRVGRKLH